ncbi:MAG: DinB family protein [Dehalococcoidia bacterium]|nr:DinB family protein [Dehalococcoidia bacterium]
MIGKEDLIKYATNVHARTYEAVERLRDEDVDWRPAPGEFSVGELVTHIANTRLMNLGGIQTGEIHYRGHVVKPGTDALALRRLVLRTGKKVVAGLVDADLGGVGGGLQAAAPPGGLFRRDEVGDTAGKARPSPPRNRQPEGAARCLRPGGLAVRRGPAGMAHGRGPGGRDCLRLPRPR